MSLNEQEIFEQAIEIDNLADRRAFLLKACDGDDDALRELASLLESANNAGSFMARHAADSLEATQETDFLTNDQKSIGKYKLLEQIGEGGFGVVYMAEQQEPIQRRVALKVIKVGMDTKQVIARFEAERQALALMDHPNIAKILDAGSTESGRPYFVMELVRGVPVTDYCDEQGLTADERLKLFAIICSAVQHAHQKGIIHRDIKPSNILVTMDGDQAIPIVIDFGIAKATQGRLTENTLFTQFRQFIGTPVYMSPEQAQMSKLDVDTRSDIYSLGILLYELITGSPPIDSKQLVNASYEEMFRRIREEEISRPSRRISSLDVEELSTLAKRRSTAPVKFSSSVRGDLDWIVMKAVEKDRSRRYETASALAGDIRRFLERQPVSAVPPSVWYLTRKFARRHQAFVFATSAVAASLLIGIVVTTLAMWKIDVARSNLAKQVVATQAALAEKEDALRKAEAETQRARDAERKALYTSYVEDMQDAHLAIEANDLQRACSLRDRYPRGFQGPGGPGWEWRALWQLSQGDEDSAMPCSGRVENISSSSDDSWLAIQTERGVDIGQPGRSPELTTLEGLVQAKFSRETDRLYGVQGGQVRWWMAPDFRTPLGSIPVDQELRWLVMTHDGTQIVALGKNGEVWAWDCETGKRSETFLRLPGDVQFQSSGRLAISRDDSRLVAAFNGQTVVYDLQAGKTLYKIEDCEARRGVEFSPDGQWIAVFDKDDRVVRLLHASDGRFERRLRGHALKVNQFAFSPDGKWFATGSNDATIRVRNTRTWEELRRLSGDSHVWAIRFSSDGSRLHSNGDHNRVLTWDLSTTPTSKWPVVAEQAFAENWQPMVPASFSHDGKQIATVAKSGKRTRLEIRSGQTLEFEAAVEEAGDRVHAVKFLPGSNSQLAVGLKDRQLSLVDLREPKKIKRIEVVQGQDIIPMDFSPNGKELLWVSKRGQDHHYGIISLADGVVTKRWKLGRTERGFSHGVITGIFLPNGHTVAIGHYHRDGIWFRSTVNGKETSMLTGLGIAHDLDISRDGKYIVARQQNKLVIIELETAKIVGELGGLRNHVSSVAFSPDGRLVAAGSHGIEAVVIWDFVTRRKLMTLRRLGDYHHYLEWSPDGSAILLGSLGGNLSLWRVPDRADMDWTLH